MASLLNVGNCDVNSLLATGLPYCDIKKSRLYGVIFLDDGVVVPAASMASQAAFTTWLAAASQAARGSRAYPLIGVFNNFEEQTPTPNKASVGNLTTKQIVVDDPIPVLSLAHSKGELLHKKLMQLEVGTYDVLLVDKNYEVFGVTQANGDLAGYSIYQTYVYPGKFLGSDAVNQYHFEITLDSLQEFKQNSGVFGAAAAIGNIFGLNNVVITQFSLASNTLKIKLVADGNKNLFDLSAIKTALTSVGAIVAIKDSDGSSFTITSVAATDTTNKVFTVVLDSTMWTALSSTATISVNMTTATLLAALGIVGFESTGALTVTKP